MYWCWTIFLQWLNLEVMGIPSNSTLNHPGIWVEFPWNFLEIPFKFHWEPIGMILEFHGVSMEFHWNFTGNPWESTGMAHSYHSCRFPVEFQHSCGFRQSPLKLMEEGKVVLLLNEAEETHLPEDSQTVLPVFAHWVLAQVHVIHQMEMNLYEKMGWSTNSTLYQMQISSSLSSGMLAFTTFTTCEIFTHMSNWTKLCLMPPNT